MGDSCSRGAWLAIALFYIFTVLCATYFGREPSEQQEVQWHLFWTLEAAQYVTATGLCELDDVFHNGLGECWGL